jgi:hypothetical protein
VDTLAKSLRTDFYRKYFEDMFQSKQYVKQWLHVDQGSPMQYVGDPNTYAEVDVQKLYQDSPRRKPESKQPRQTVSTLQSEYMNPELFEPTPPELLTTQFGTAPEVSCFISVRDDEVLIITDYRFMSMINEIIRKTIHTYPRKRGPNDRLHPTHYPVLPTLSIIRLLYSIPLDLERYHVIEELSQKHHVEENNTFPAHKGIVDLSKDPIHLILGIIVWHQEFDNAPRMFFELQEGFTQSSMRFNSSAAWETGVGTVLAIMHKLQEISKEEWIHEIYQECREYIKEKLGSDPEEVLKHRSIV